MIGYPLDSHVTYEADGTPVYDRGISSAPLRSLIKKLFSDGVMPNPSTNMQVVASTGMNVQVQAGFALTGGCLKLLESAETLTIEAASTLPRIDAIVLRLDDNDNVRTCELAVKKGTAASSPVAPTVRRDEVMWEICLAQIAVAANTTAITNANITDTRLDTDLCGYISSISEFDTTTLYQQIQSDLEFFREDEQARLTAWFDTFIDELTTDQAINLQNQINVLDYKIDNLDVLDTTEEIAANTDPGKITGALATKSVIDSLNAFQFREESGKPQYKLETEGADAWRFFKLDIDLEHPIVSDERTSFTGGSYTIPYSGEECDAIYIAVMNGNWVQSYPYKSSNGQGGNIGNYWYMDIVVDGTFYPASLVSQNGISVYGKIVVGKVHLKANTPITVYGSPNGGSVGNALYCYKI